MRELKLFAAALRQMDDNAELTMKFYERPDWRVMFFYDLLATQVVRVFKEMPDSKMLPMSIDQIQELATTKKNQVTNLLMDQFWNHMYPTHEVHFHKSIENWISCPFTCLTEVADCVEKIVNQTEGVN